MHYNLFHKNRNTFTLLSSAVDNVEAVLSVRCFPLTRSALKLGGWVRTVPSSSLHSSSTHLATGGPQPPLRPAAMNLNIAIKTAGCGE